MMETPQSALLIRNSKRLLFSAENIKRILAVVKIVSNLRFKRNAESECHSPFLLHFIPVEEPIGRGDFGVVFNCRKRHFNTGLHNEFEVVEPGTSSSSNSPIQLEDYFALKLVEHFSVQDCLSEVMVLSRLVHPHIVACYNVWVEQRSKVGEWCWSQLDLLIQKRKRRGSSSSWSGSSKQESANKDPSILILQYELCREATLVTMIDGRDYELSPDVANYLFCQLIEALIYLQIHGVIHLDIKPDNIFIKKEDGIYFAKLGDFGLSVVQSNKMLYYGDDLMNPDLNTRPFYDPPEKRDGTVSHKGDMYSLGLVYMTMMLAPFPSPEQRRRTLVACMRWKGGEEGDIPAEVECIPPLSKCVIASMLSHDPDKRPTAEEVKKQLGTSFILYPNEYYKLEGKDWASLNFALRQMTLKTDIRIGYRLAITSVYKAIVKLLQTANSTKEEPGLQEHAMMLSLAGMSVAAKGYNRPEDQYYILSLCLNALTRLGKQKDHPEYFVQFQHQRVIAASKIGSLHKGFDSKLHPFQLLRDIMGTKEYTSLSPSNPVVLDIIEDYCDFLVGANQSWKTSSSYLADLEGAILELTKVENARVANVMNHHIPGTESKLYVAHPCRILKGQVYSVLNRWEDALACFNFLLQQSVLTHLESLESLSAFGGVCFQASAHAIYRFLMTGAECGEEFGQMIIVEALVHAMASYVVHGLSQEPQMQELSATIRLMSICFDLLGVSVSLENLLALEYAERERQKLFGLVVQGGWQDFSSVRSSIGSLLLDDEAFVRSYKRVLGIPTIHKGLNLPKVKPPSADRSLEGILCAYDSSQLTLFTKIGRVSLYAHWLVDKLNHKVNNGV